MTDVLRRAAIRVVLACGLLAALALYGGSPPHSVLVGDVWVWLP